MNLVIETLNVWADHAFRFAWPMLWQSSLLIGLLFALDALMKRKLRPAVRYALWLVVLVKLLLPPSLAFPTNPGWWLRPTKAVPARPRPTSVVVTYGAAELPALPAAATPIFVAPLRPHLTPAAWALVGMVTVGLGLLAWMLMRWHQVARDARRAAEAPARLGELLPKLRRPVRLRLTDQPQSPAVCGLFHPAILLPRSLAEQLPPTQLRAVLLHELLHLRRGDVWVNCAQALLQIVYWWHPLLWFANARIRRVREEAVDDGVMLALNEDAGTYAPTLLEVAKLALHRPLASLGLVGILESRSSLRQRIERLMNFRPPRRAGLTLASALAVLGFAAVAVPMGKAPAPSEVTQSAASPLTTNNLASDGLSSSGVPGEHQPLYMRTFKINEITLVEGLHVPLGPVATNGSEAIFHALLDHLSQAGVDLDPVRNPGKSIFYTDRSGLLLVRATLKDLDIIERKIAALRIAAGNEPAPGTVPESPSSPMTNSGSVSNRLSSPGLTAEQNVKASTLVQDGKLLYEMDKLDEAEGKLKLAIKSDPHNEAALYYLNLVSAAKFARAAKLHQMPEEAAVNEAVYRQANRITLRQRLADARAAQDRHALASAAKLYEDAWELVLRIGSGVDAERDQTIAGLTAVRMELARAAQARGDYKEARTQVGDVLRVDPTSAVAVEFKSKNEKLLAEQRGKIPSEEVRSEVPAIIEEQVKASTLVHDGKLLYEMGKLDEAEAKLEKAITKDPQNQAAAYYLSLVKEARQKTTGGLGQWLSTPAPHAQTNLIKRQAIVHMLDNIRLDQVAFDATPLSEVLRFLGDESRKGDPEQRGINFILNQNTDSGTSAAAATLGPDGRPLPPGPAEQVDLSSIAINLKYPLTNIRLADVLDAIVKVADRPIKYSIEDYGVVFSARARQQSPPLYLRTFKVDPNTLLEGLHLSKRQVETSGRDVVTRALRDCFARAGVDLDPARNPAKAVFFNDRQGMVVARATMQDLDIIEAVIQMLNYAPPQINLKCKVVAVSAGDTKALGFDWYLGNMLMNSGLTGGQVGTAPSSNGVPTVANPLGVFSDNPSARATLTPSTNTQPLTSVTRLVNSPSFTTTGILTDPQFTVLIKALEQRAGTELIAQPEATVLSGRQVLCKATEVHTVVKGIKDKALTPPGVTSTNKDENSVFGVEPMEFGVELDMKPTVLEDGYTIRMPVAATVLSFLGYDDAPTNRVAAYVNGKWEWVTPPLPCIRIQQMASTANVHDGQTLVLGGLVSERIIAFKDQVPVLGELPVVGRLFRSESKNTQKRDLLIFVTPTIIDPAGNRVHSPDENPSSPNEIPAQPPR